MTRCCNEAGAPIAPPAPTLSGVRRLCVRCVPLMLCCIAVLCCITGAGQVFAAFDIDGSGEINSKELLLMGKARRELGQKKDSEWSEEKNARMVKRLDADGSGKIEEKEFVAGFEEVRVGYVSCGC